MINNKIIGIKMKIKNVDIEDLNEDYDTAHTGNFSGKNISKMSSNWDKRLNLAGFKENNLNKKITKNRVKVDPTLINVDNFKKNKF